MCEQCDGTNLFCPFLPLFLKIEFFADNIDFSHTELLEFWLENGRNSASLVNFVLQQSKRKLKPSTEVLIKKKINNFVAFVQINITKCNRMVSRFKTAHREWLAKRMEIQFQACDFLGESIKNVGRPRLTYDEGSSRLKRKLAAEVAADNNNNTDLLLHAASASAKKLRLINVKDERMKPEPVPFTAEEALDF